MRGRMRDRQAKPNTTDRPSQPRTPDRSSLNPLVTTTAEGAARGDAPSSPPPCFEAGAATAATAPLQVVPLSLVDGSVRPDLVDFQPIPPHPVTPDHTEATAAPPPSVPPQCYPAHFAPLPGTWPVVVNPPLPQVELFDAAVNLFRPEREAEPANEVLTEDLAALLQRAEDAGVHYQILPGTTVATSRRYCAFAARMNARPPAQRTTTFFVAVGVHPVYASTFDDATTVSDLRSLCCDRQYAGCVVAVGECGLDYARLSRADKEQQQRCFEAQCRLAAELGLPLYTHERQAHGDFLACLDAHRFGDGRCPGVPRVLVHCFSGHAYEMAAYAQRDFYLGIAGIVCMPHRGADLSALLAHVPPHRLVIETDTPWLHPSTEYFKATYKEAYRSQRSEPRHLRAVLHRVAGLQRVFLGNGAIYRAVAGTTTANALNFCGRTAETWMQQTQYHVYAAWAHWMASGCP